MSDPDGARPTAGDSGTAAPSVQRCPAARQFGMLVSLPSIAVTTLLAYGVIHATLALACGLGVALLLGNGVGWRLTPATFDRERLIIGSR